MKKKPIKILSLGLIVFVLLGNACSAQQMDAAKVPVPVKESFSKTFHGVSKVKWEKEGGNYEANFKQDGKTISAVMGSNGVLVETETDINISELPAAVANYIATHYKAKKIKEAALIKKAGGEINYEAEVNGKDVLFNSNGEFIKEAND